MLSLLKISIPVTLLNRELKPGSASPFFEFDVSLKSHLQLGRFYNTYDLARYLPSGEIELLGRQDRQVKIMGTISSTI